MYHLHIPLRLPCRSYVPSIIHSMMPFYLFFLLVLCVCVVNQLNYYTSLFSSLISSQSVTVSIQLLFDRTLLMHKNIEKKKSRS